MTGGEVLVVDYAPEASASAWPISMSVPPRVVVLAAGPDALPDIARLARFAMARTSAGVVEALGDETVLDELDEGARVFVEAWRTRPLEKPDRPGEGLPWDASGFEPPDPPPGWVDPSRRQGRNDHGR